MRKDWDNYFMDIAFEVAERSTCERLHVGSLLVKNKRIKGTGYNGSPKGLPHCQDEGCFMSNNHCVRTIHAEVNCLMEVSPEDRQDATLYVTHTPCPECQKVIINSGVTRVVFAKEYKPTINWFEYADWIELVDLARDKNEEERL